MKSVHTLCYQNIDLFVWASLHSNIGLYNGVRSGMFSLSDQWQTRQRSGNLCENSPYFFKPL